MSNYDPTDLRGQDLEKREIEARKRVIRENENADVKWLMSSKKGRRVMWRLLELAGPFRMSFDPNAMKMAFNEGNRNLGNQLFNEVMTLCPEMYPVMVREQQDFKEQQDGKRDGNGEQSN
jgi:hypothetical protein